jgi:hypothetical protein
MSLAGSSNAVSVTAAYTSQILSMVNDEKFSDLTFKIKKIRPFMHTVTFWHKVVMRLPPCFDPG